jgi:hypothetical protein
MEKQEFLRLPVVSASAEFLVMSYLMRRNILAYNTPPNNEGYDLICIHPNPRHQRLTYLLRKSPMIFKPHLSYSRRLQRR